MSAAPQPVFNIEKTYVRDLSLEVPNAPHIFMEGDAPEVAIQLSTQAAPVGDGVFESVVGVTVTAMIGDKTVFLVEVKQAGIFRIQHVPEQDLDPILGIACPNILFPFAREVVADAVNRAGFAPVILAPVNFEAIYQQRLAEAQARANGAVEQPATVQ
ncbi:MAG: protein-export chaperone SecB [Rhodocyclaceae bacterium]|jgi:preprotein translocase subunit SecB|nr:protein-export chaperone SecB [Rhodocyclaceae bacterium]